MYIMFKKKKYSCVFCNDRTKIKPSKVAFCKECNALKNHIRLYGLKPLLNYIDSNKPSAPNCPSY